MDSSRLLRVSTVLSLSFRTRPRRWTVVATTECHRVRCISPSTPAQQTHVTDRRTHDGPSCMTVISVRDPSPKGLHIFYQVSYDGHVQRTVITVTVHPAHTVIIVRDFPLGFFIYTESKYNTMDLMTVRHSHDEPSPGPS